MDQQTLSAYSQLIVRGCLTVQSGQELVVRASTGQAELVRLIVADAYAAGAKDVRVDWFDQAIERLHYLNQTEDRLSEIEPWWLARLAQDADRQVSQLYLVDEDPEGLSDVDSQLLMKVRQRRFPVIKPIRDRADNRYVWVIAAAASPAWAQRVFPERDAESATEALWELIVAACHMQPGDDGEAAVARWDAHQEGLQRRAALLSEAGFSELRFRSANGTDFRCGLIPGALWMGGGDTTLGGQRFSPNMPTEEVFTSPMRGQAEGLVVSTKPLSWNGQLIDDFRIRFEDGRAVEWSAARGEEALSALIGLDEGAAYLGELALVPQSSPIQRAGVLFHNTLFDENASCHIALGRGFSNLIPGFESMDETALSERGLNHSMSHVDFMIGADDLDIDGVLADGTTRAIMRSGAWAEDFA